VGVSQRHAWAELLTFRSFPRPDNRWYIIIMPCRYVCGTGLGVWCGVCLWWYVCGTGVVYVYCYVCGVHVVRVLESISLRVCVCGVCGGKEWYLMTIIEPWSLTNNCIPRPTASFSFGLCCTAKQKAGKTWGHSSCEWHRMWGGQEVGVGEGHITNEFKHWLSRHF